MPILYPPTYAYVVDVIRDRPLDVNSREYEFELDPSWVKEMSKDAIVYFASRPRESLAISASIYTPPDVLLSILQRNPPRYALVISRNTAATSSILLEIAKSCLISAEVINALSEHQNADARVFRALVDSGKPDAQFAVARSSRAPAECLSHLAKSPIVAIRGVVAQNPATPDSTLSLLRIDSEVTVSTAVLANPRVRQAEGRCTRCGDSLGFFRKLTSSDICGKH